MGEFTGYRLPVISPPESFATKIFILSINTEVDNKRASLNALVFKITQVALLFCDFLVIIVQ